MRQLLWFLLLVAVLPSASAQVLAERALRGVTDFPAGTAAACFEDLDADGDLDLVTTHPHEGGFIRVLAQHQGAFAEVWRAGGIANVTTALWIDLANDGYPDVIASGLSISVAVFANAEGRLATTPTFVENAPTSNAPDLDAGDLNGDGFLNVVVAPRQGNPDVLLYNVGSGKFDPVAPDMIDGPRLDGAGASFSDYDGDGDLDVLFLGLDGNRLYRNLGGTFVRAEGATVEAQRGNISASWGDYDADGDLDLYIAGQQEDVLYDNLGGQLIERIVYPAHTSETSSSVWFDLDLDGDLDLIQSRNGAASEVLRNEKGIFTAEAFGPTGVSVSAVATDPGADGRVDVLLTRGGFGMSKETDRLYVVESAMGTWLSVLLRGERSNAHRLHACPQRARAP
ncbi:MAG: VCBS repeat-containing protein [Bacteroidota bacterium]